MGHIFDIRLAKLYESWHHSPKGRAMDSFVERLIPVLVEPKKYERVLDIGCGTGNHLLIFNRMGMDINGIDASPYMIDRARKRIGDRCNFKTGMAEDLPFDDNEFDLAIMINTLEFLDNPLEALREAGRVSKKKVFICVINSLSWYYAFHKLSGLFRETICKYIHSYTLWGSQSLLRMAYGHAPVEWRCDHGWPFSAGKMIGLSSDSSGSAWWPFGSFLVLCARMNYRVKTDNLPLKIRVKKQEEPVAGGITNAAIRSADSRMLRDRVRRK